LHLTAQRLVEFLKNVVFHFLPALLAAFSANPEDTRRVFVGAAKDCSFLKRDTKGRGKGGKSALFKSTLFKAQPFGVRFLAYLGNQGAKSTL